MKHSQEDRDSLVPPVVDEMLWYAAEDVVMDEVSETLDDPEWVESLDPAGRYEIVRRVDPSLNGLPNHLLRSSQSAVLLWESIHRYMNRLFIRARTWAHYRRTDFPSIGDWIVFKGMIGVPQGQDPFYLRRVRNVSRDGPDPGPTFYTDDTWVTGNPYESICLGGGRTRTEALSSALTNYPERRVDLIRWMGRENTSL